MPIEKQFSIFVQNKVGSLSAICANLAKERVNIKAISILDDLEWGIVRLIVDDPEKTRAILQKLGLMYGESQVLTVEIENHPGSLSDLAEKLSARKINIDQAFATGAGSNTLVVMATTDDKKAATILS